MTDFMLLGILRMPIEADDGVVAFTQFRSAARSAAERITTLTAERDALIAQRDAVPFDTDALGMGLEMAAQSTIRIVTKERNEALADNARLREALADIVADCEATYPPSHGAIKYAARLAITGKEPSHE